MKITSLLLFLNTICSAQIINFPDANFKAKLLTNDIACIGVSANLCAGGPIDANNDGEIEVSEAQSVAILSVSGANISDLTGIEYFTNLEWLICSSNNLTTINLSSLTSLTTLNCRNNQLTILNLASQTLLDILACNNNQITSLDISHQSELKIFIASNNQISFLDFSNNTALEHAYFSENLLTSLDFSNNPNFFDLGCKNDPNLTSIKIRNSVTQAFGTGTLYNECWSNVPNLNYICADSNEIPALQSYLSGCGIDSSGITINSDCELGNQGFEFGSMFILSPVPAKNSLTITTKEEVEMSSVSIYNILGQLVQVNTNPNETIDVSGLETGSYFIKIISDKGTASTKFVKE
ncbi:T9SS type A sorting domain-containing protein [Flavobacterium sp.]|uniref:T9SS type A sorting domain-containing protein n=1 Tax=Flavobacterium sp. TaxID=239 RepID=UPI0024894645|nr:T9SS type A sorting domain-containing protein [Flavobacterium sp.]MDI1316065.1 T9SS type A sorting domain-containing protein [Flavobacterium sp.]